MHDNSCYEDNSTPTYIYSFTVKGQLKNNLVEPEWVGGEQPKFNVTQKIPINFSISTDCSNEGLISGADSKSITLIHNSDEYPCNPDDSGTGYYNCSWDSTNKPEGNYSIKLESTELDYNDNTTTYLDWFWLENLNTTAENMSVNPSSGGWSRFFNYTVDISDPEADEVNCTLFISKDDANSWIEKGNDTIPGSGTCSIIVDDFQCADIDALTNFTLEIDDGTNKFNTTIMNGPYLNESIVNVTLVSGDGISIDRNYESKPLKIQVCDEEKNTCNVDNVNTTFWITNRTGVYDSGHRNQTETDGMALYDFPPDCNYSTGKQYWIAGVTEMDVTLIRTQRPTLLSIFLEHWRVLLHNRTERST